MGAPSGPLDASGPATTRRPRRKPVKIMPPPPRRSRAPSSRRPPARPTRARPRSRPARAPPSASSASAAASSSSTASAATRRSRPQVDAGPRRRRHDRADVGRARRRARCRAERCAGTASPAARSPPRAATCSCSVGHRRAARSRAERAAPTTRSATPSTSSTTSSPCAARTTTARRGARFGAGRGGHSHQGQDVMAKCGTKLVAARGGIVKFSGYHSAAGNYVVIDGDDDRPRLRLHAPARRRRRSTRATASTPASRSAWSATPGTSTALPPALRDVERAGLVRRRRSRSTRCRTCSAGIVLLVRALTR